MNVHHQPAMPRTELVFRSGQPAFTPGQRAAALRERVSAADGHALARRGRGFQGAVGTAGMTVSCNTSACLAADMGVQGGIPGRDNQLDNNDFIVFIDNFFNHTGCP